MKVDNELFLDWLWLEVSSLYSNVKQTPENEEIIKMIEVLESKIRKLAGLNR